MVVVLVASLVAARSWVTAGEWPAALAAAAGGGLSGRRARVTGRSHGA